MKLIYHKTTQAVYIDNGDGSLSSFDHKGNPHRMPMTIALIKNNPQGWQFVAKLKVKMNRTRFDYLYRCPSSGTYDNFADGKRVSHSRRGNVNKDRALVVNVRNAH